MILSPNDVKYFFSCPRHCDQGLIVIIVNNIQIWNKKEHNIIISKIISSHMGPLYIMTSCIKGCINFETDLNDFISK